MAILNNNPLVGASGNQGGYNINNSVRLRSSASAYLSRTPASAGNQKTWTYSAWVKRGLLGSIQDIWHANGPSTTENDYFAFDSDTLQFRIKNSNVVVCELITTQVFRDPSAWYHIIVAWDSTQATSSNRVKIYVNGVQVTSFSTATYPSQNTNTNSYNSNVLHTIGTQWYSSTLSNYYDGYITEINFIDGQALTPTSFGETDTTTGVWKPKAYTGTYGTNGFYLKFSDIATTSGSNAGLGKDFSGNSNYWTTNNISVTSGTTYDAMTDVPTNTSATVANYAVMNPLELGDGAPAALSNGNLTITGSSTLYLRRGTMNFPTTGKYYCEFTVTAVGSGVSIAYDARGQNGATQFIQYNNDGTKNVNGTTTSYGASFTTNDVIALAVDADGGNVYFYKNNTSQGAISLSSASMTGVNATAMVFAYTSAVVNANFGQRPFSYTPPSGFVALNTYNLPTPTILKGNKYMDATLYTGNGTSQTITNAGAFKPDFFWVKGRSYADFHVLEDTVRGVTKSLSSEQTAAEVTRGTAITAFTSTGFTVGSDTLVNYNGQTTVAWQWQAGQGSTSSNTSGSITSTVSVNTTAGFSVVTYTGTGSNATVGHGLGVAPSMVIVKSRTTAENWMVYHTSTGATKYIYLDSTGAAVTLSTIWNNTAPTSSVFSIGTNVTVNQSSTNYVAYCWAEIAGFSKFGSYTGNASTDGPFVYLGFRPKFVIFKDYSNAHSWVMVDSSRNTYNVAGDYLRAESSAAENATYSVANNTAVDFLSNGFKLRNAAVNSGENNGSSNYLYMAWAENPFKNANAR